ncbi:MAG: penicillin-binding protein 2 [Chloroflexaceae bacterium]|nr:penicillin-binding protein 2 [Chloroflexaceae bacterium]
MQSTVRLLSGASAISLIIFGLSQPAEQEISWLICLWLAAPLIGLTAWFYQPRMPRGIQRSVYALGLIIIVGFGLLSLQLLRQQLIYADTIYNRVVQDPESGQIISNVRPVLASQRVLRGDILDRTGLLLVSSEQVADGFANRTYPLATVSGYDPAAFSNIVGFFSPRYGQSGLEATYSGYLSGEQGSPSDYLKHNLLGETQVGNNLHLTLHAGLQARASALLGAWSGSIVVLDPRSGAVLAMVSHPGFDPRGLSFNYAADREAENTRISQYWQSINSDSSGQPLLNRATQGQYPPGSTFKTVTAVAALEHPDVAQPNTIRCYNELPVEQGSPPVVNAVDNLASLTGDPSDLERVYAYSCNVAFAQYALRLRGDGRQRPDLFEQQATLFDIVRPQDAPPMYDRFTALPTLPSRLYVQPDFLDRLAAVADTGYGQGQILVTPLQMAMVAATIANDGVMLQPYLVQQIRSPDNRVIFEERTRTIRQVMSVETAREMRNHMAAVAEYGFGSQISSFVPGVSVGGKSGTAEHVPGATPHAWFIAIAPLDAPRYAVAVIVEGGGEGSGIAAQLAGQVLAAAFATES